MLLNPAQHVRRQQINPAHQYKGWVIDNDDPTKNQRVRVHVPGIMDYENNEHYPWCLPQHAHPDGASNYSGTVSVPKVNAVVGVHFQATPTGEGDINYPTYGAFHVTDPTQLKDGEHHYPNRKVHRLSNGTFAIIDTEDDSVWLYNYGETHVKSGGKLVIKSEETFVIISDVEVGIRAPEIAVRAKDHLILESENKLTMRCAGEMNIETRDQLRMLAKKGIDIEAIDEDIQLLTRGEGQNGEGNIVIDSKKDSVKLVATGEQTGRQANVELDSKKNDVKVFARGEQKTEKSSFLVEVDKNDIVLHAASSNYAQEDTKIEIINDAYDLVLKADALQKSGLMRAPKLEIEQGDGDMTIKTKKKDWTSNIDMSADQNVTIKAKLSITLDAPDINVSVS